MTRDKLFLLKNDFLDKGQGPFYCPDCALVYGVLSYFPQLKTELDIQVVDFTRPRPEVIKELGEQNQGCPVLILGAAKPETIKGLEVGEYQGKQFISGAEGIGKYLARAYGVSRPH